MHSNETSPDITVEFLHDNLLYYCLISQNFTNVLPDINTRRVGRI